MSEITFVLLSEKIGPKSYFISLIDGIPAGFCGVNFDTRCWADNWVNKEFRGNGLTSKFESFLISNYPGEPWSVVAWHLPPTAVLRYQLKDGFTVSNPEGCEARSLEVEQKRSALGESTYAKVLEIWNAQT